MPVSSCCWAQDFQVSGFGLRPKTLATRLFVHVHHAAFDGASLRCFEKDLWSLYQAGEMFGSIQLDVVSFAFCSQGACKSFACETLAVPTRSFCPL